VNAKSLPDLARAAYDLLEEAHQMVRDLAAYVTKGRTTDPIAGLLATARRDAHVACAALAERLTVEDDQEHVLAIGDAARDGYSTPEMGLVLLRIAAHADAAERDTEPPSDPAAVDAAELAGVGLAESEEVVHG